MMHVWKKLLAGLLALALLLPLLGAAAEPLAAYGVCTGSQVAVRKQIGGDYWFRVDAGHVAKILDTRMSNGELWYKIESPHPVANGRTYTGYILGKFFRPMTDAEISAYLGQEAPTDTPANDSTGSSGTAVSGAQGIVTANGVSLRASRSTGAAALATLNEGAAVELLSIPETISVNDWYRVRYQDKVGYIQANFIRVTDQGDDASVAIARGMTVNTNGVNLRTGPGTGYPSLGRLPAGVELELLSIPEKTDSNHWYRVRHEGRTGYINAPYIRALDGNETPTPTPTPAPSAVVSTGVTTSASGVKLRNGPGTGYSYYGKLDEGTVVELLSIPAVIDTEHWYKVRYNNRVGYIQAPFIRVLTVNENDLPDVARYGYARLINSGSVNLRDAAGGETVAQWSGKGSLMRIAGEPQQKGLYTWYPVYHVQRRTILFVREDMIDVVLVEDGSIVPKPSGTPSPYGYVITTGEGVNLRINPADDPITSVPRNTVLACVGPAQRKEMNGVDYTWYKVKYNGMTGYLRGDYVRVCTADGGAVAEDEPAPTPTPEAEYGYIRLTKGGVNLRRTPAGTSQAQLDKGTILPVVAEPAPYGKYGKYVWYPVLDAKNRFGWIRSDCAEPCDQNGSKPGADVPTTPPAAEEPDLSGVSGRINGNAYLFDTAYPDAEIIALMPANAVVPVLSIPEDTANGWYRVRYNGLTGFVHASQLELLPSGDQTNQSGLGYVMITGSQVAVRMTAGGTVLTRVATGTVWPIIGANATGDGVTWFHVRADGYEGYVHGDYAFKLSPAQEESYLAGNGVPAESPEEPEIIPSQYLITVNTSGLNIREHPSQDSTSYGKVPSGVVMPFFATRKVGTVTWYCVLYDHQERWVHGGYVKEMSQAEYATWAAAHPDQATSLGYLRTNQANVYVRNAANGSERVALIARKGTVMPYYTEMISAGGAGWYRVLTPDNGYCYVRDDLVVKCDKDGNDLPLQRPDNSGIPAASQSQQETSYTTLRLGDGGTDTKAGKVLNLVQELTNQGYYTGKLTNIYTSEVKTAVEVFQADKGLYVDGIAGSATQHALFGTVPIGAGNTSNLDFPIYPVEKIDWFTGGIQDMIPRGANFKVYDVKTGIVWWAHRWAGVYHADIETLTAADSARLCQIYGVKNLQEIVDGNMWQRRPCLVTIGTRTFACSLDGMQHNPAGDTIPNNNMNGQICLHFTNSTGHEKPVVSTTHAEAIEYAYNHCPAGKK